MNGAVNASGEAHNSAYADHLDLLGEAYKRLDADEVKELTGSEFYSSGLFLPGAVMLQPALYVRELALGLTTKQTHPVIRPGRIPEEADRLFMVETIEPGQPVCEPGRRLVICHNKGQAMRPEIEGIVGIARIHAPKLKQFRPYEHVVFEWRSDAAGAHA